MHSFASSRKPDAAEIAERITTVVMEHRLAPGMKLVEERLATAFGVSRTKIRQALALLASEGLVKLLPNRGAFVATPTVREAVDLFATRKLVEPEVIRNVIELATKADLARLREHLALEADARGRGDRRAIIKLSGAFHLLLAEVGGNSFIAKLMDELCPMTCLIVALYDSPNTAACPEDEHGAIVAAIERREADLAVRLMLDHLGHVETELRLRDHDRREIDWERMFG